MGENDLTNKTTPTLVSTWHLWMYEFGVWQVSHTLIMTEVTEVTQGSGIMQITVTKGGKSCSVGQQMH